MKSTPNRSVISVITVCRNSAVTIARAFESVLSQSYPSIDYVVVDGASTDGTVDVIKQYATGFGAKGVRFGWRSEPDQGIYDAWNKGIARAQGDIIGILNSDDFYEPDTLQSVASACGAHPDAGIFYGFLRVLLEDGRELQTYRYRYEHYLLNPESGVFGGGEHPTCFVRRGVYEQIGAFDTQFPVAADYDFLVRAMKHGVRFQPLDKVLCNLTLGGASTVMNDYERLKQRFGVLSKNGLLSERESRKMHNQVKYQRYKAAKQRIVQKLFGL